MEERWTAEELAEAVAAWERYRRTNRISPFVKQIWLAGVWLYERLQSRGMPAGQIKAVCFANGQKCLYGDPWLMAEETLAECDRGEAPRPGAEFAATLEATRRSPAKEE